MEIFTSLLRKVPTVLCTSISDSTTTEWGKTMKIETKNLMLRSFVLEDFVSLHEFLSDVSVMKFTEPAFDLEQTREFLEEFCIEEESALAVVEKSSGNVIGCMQFFEDTEPEVYQIGWIFNKDYWGQGFAYESASALMTYGFETLNLQRIYAQTMDPIKSVGLMKKLGMVKEGQLRNHNKSSDDNEWRDRFFYGILKEEYLNLLQAGKC